jgi:phospholipid transport system transporter-binding protein
MIRAVGERLEVDAPMTLATASALLAEGIAACAEGPMVFDLGRVAEVDSSSLAVVFGWQRAARERGGSIRIVNPPQDLLSLADVYGVADLVPVA